MFSHMNFFMVLTGGLLDFLVGLEAAVPVLLSLLRLLLLTGVHTSWSSYGSSSSCSSACLLCSGTNAVDPSTATSWNIRSMSSRKCGHPHLHYFHSEWPCRTNNHCDQVFIRACKTKVPKQFGYYLSVVFPPLVSGINSGILSTA